MNIIHVFGQVSYWIKFLTIFCYILGSFADKSGDYSITFYMAGVSLALAGIICIPLRRISAWEKNKNKQKLAQEFVNQNGKSCEEKILLEKKLMKVKKSES